MVEAGPEISTGSRRDVPISRLPRLESPVVQVRRILGSEWRQLRQLRLAALAGSPDAFGSTWARESELPEADWRERARAGALGHVSATYVVEDGDGKWVGLVTGLRTAEGGGADLVSLWVAPTARGHGLARQLVESVLAWATDQGLESVRLWVTAENQSARPLYERCGFVETGAEKPLPSNPSKVELQMERRLAPGRLHLST